MDNAFISQYFDWDCRSPDPRYRFLNRVLKKFLKVRIVPASFTWEMANVEARMNLFHLVSQAAAYDVPGDAVEVGCNSGESSIVIRKVLNTYSPVKELHVYDSFNGLPELTGTDNENGIYGKGHMIVPRQRLVDKFEEVGAVLPHIHEGWFEETIPAQLPEKISFALIDGDTYASTRHVLPHVYERLSRGAVVMFGVYYYEKIFRRDDTLLTFKSPGVKRATDEFFRDKPEAVSVLYANEYSNGYFRKL